MKPKPKLKQIKLILGMSFTVLAAFAGAAVYFNVAAPAETMPETTTGTAMSSGAGFELPADPSESGAVESPKRAEAAEPSDAIAKTEANPRNAAERLAKSLSPVQHGRLLTLINEGTPRELLKIHGVGKTRAEAIQKARPFETVAQLAAVHGVGKVTYASVIAYGREMGERETIVAIAAPSVR